MNKVVYVISVYDPYENIWLPYSNVFISEETAREKTMDKELREKLTIITECELVAD